MRFGEFENSYRGFVELSLTALNDEYDVVGFVTENVPINGREKRPSRCTSARRRSSPIWPEPSVDMAAPDQAAPADPAASRTLP